MSIKPKVFNDRFAFCSGFENSYPVITDHRGKDLRRDGFDLSGHYHHWRHDLKLVSEMGLDYLRYGPPYYLCHAGPDKYNWSFPDKTFKLLRQLKIEPIADLLHFGLPDWLGASFQNPDWPEMFAEYAAAFAKRYHWVRLYTPVNEILVAAEFSGLNGWWNERLKSDQAFVTALKHLCRALILAEQAILAVRPDAIFVQSESSTYFHPAIPEAQDSASFLNQRRFIPLDLCFGHAVDASIYEYLCDNGMSPQEYRWFMEQAPPLRPNCIMGSDYYISNEKKVTDRHGTAEGSGEVLGYYEITKQYHERYKLPIFHTETNRKDEKEAVRWLYKEWFNILKLRGDDLPILGFTWYSFFDQTDWDVQLREDNHRINPMGLYDLNRKIRPVGEAYRHLIAKWRPALLAQPQYRKLSTAKPISRRIPGHGANGSPKRSPIKRERAPGFHGRQVSRNEG